MERGRSRLQRRTPLRKEGRPPFRRDPWWRRFETHVTSHVELYLSAVARGLLRDRINNHLQVVLFSLAGSGAAAATDEDRERLVLAIGAVAAVSRTLEELSADSLRRWQRHYGDVVSGAASFGGSAAGSGRDGSGEGR